jgi:glycosyltransferase involved in cell wall biosynthesis
VIASQNGNPTIGPCLEALLAQRKAVEIEVIVAQGSSDGARVIIAEQYPEIRLISLPGLESVPQLRGRGIAAANGEIVAILDPYCIVEPDWVRNLIAAHDERAEPAIGGSVALDRADASGLVAWATYFSEYADFIPPIRHGRVKVLPGNNIAYKRAALNGADQDGFWKTFTNQKLVEDGKGLWSTPAISVRLRKEIPFREFLMSRYHHGRCFAGMRVENTSAARKLLRALTIPVLPFLFLWRGWASVWSKQRYRSRYLLTMPLLFSFNLSWAWGELWGYLRGPGRSCGQLLF